jgi:hyperosmotically inducible protein
MSPLTRTALLLLAITVAPAAVAAQRPHATDAEIAREVGARLMAHNITGVTIGVAGGVVTLRGSTPTLWTKERAIDETMKVADVISVVSDITVPRGEDDDAIAQAIADKLSRYVFFSIFDDADVAVVEGVVTLTGRVTMPHKAEAFADLAAHVPGVQEVRNEVRTLPASLFDDQLRYAVARRIYGDEMFVRYAIQANPPIHIIVERGAVTLTGAVGSDMERRVAETIARTTFSVMSVTNNLRVERSDN